MKYILLVVIGLCSIDLTLSQWQELPDFQTYCNTAVLADSNNIWGGGNLGKIFHYDISNQTFDYRQFDEEFDFQAVYPLNDSTLLLGGWVNNNDFDDNGFYISYRCDIDSIIFSSFHPYPIWDIEFISQDTGFFSNFDGIHKTTDRGNSWERIWEVDSIGAEFGDIYSITTDSTGGIYASGEKRQNLEGLSFQGFVLKSIDCGASWELVFENPHGNIWGLEYRHGTVYCHDKNRTTIYSSQDSGATWNTYNIPISDETLTTSDVTFLSRNHLIACIAHEYGFLSDETDNKRYMILDSPDNGLTWYVQHEFHSPYSPDCQFLLTLGAMERLKAMATELKVLNGKCMGGPALSCCGRK